VTVYRAKPKPDVRFADLNDEVALLHSPRAAKRFIELVGEDSRGAIKLAAISPEAADAAGQGWALVEAADSPNDDALLALAERLCNNPPS
jgi:uroporphyrinogen-III synthase